MDEIIEDFPLDVERKSEQGDARVGFGCWSGGHCGWCFGCVENDGFVRMVRIWGLNDGGWASGLEG